MNGAEFHQSKDWVSDVRIFVVAWGLPSMMMIAGMFLAPSIRTGMWAGALVWMGVACVANAVRCRRTHCYFTGPYFLALAVVTVLHGFQIVWLEASGWFWLGVTIIAGGGVLWGITEKAWGKFRGFESLS